MRLLLMITAIFEATTALVVLACPAFFASMLLGESTLDESGLAIARIAGVALLSLATACWSSRDSISGKAILKTMLLYHIGVPGILVYAFLNADLGGKFLWPAIVTHTALMLWTLVAIVSSQKRK